MSGKNDSYPTRRVSSEPIQWPEDNWNGGGEWHLEYPYTLGMPCPFSDRSGGNAPQDRKVETARKAVLKGRRILRPHLKDRSYNMTQNSTVVTDTQHSTDTPGNGITAFVPTQGELVHLMKYAVKKVIHDDYSLFAGLWLSDSDLRRIDFDRKRVDEIAQLLGAAETDKAVTNAYEEAALDYEHCHWIVFRYGTRKEQTLYQKKGYPQLLAFKREVREKIAGSVAIRVLSEGVPEQKQALGKDQATRYEKTRLIYKWGWQGELYSDT
jgi:hypothetical protein